MATKPDCKTIKIQCKGADVLPLDAIEDLQGSLKKRSKKDIDSIIKSIEKYGFSFPFFVWNGDGHNRCMDGHGRIQALCEMRKCGVSLPLFPVAYIDAVDENEAKQKLLRLNSQYGQMSMDSVLEFTSGLEVEWDELALPGRELLSFGDSEPEESKPEPNSLSEVFLVPPFSIFDTRQGYWVERKRWWLDQIGDNGETRENTLGNSVSGYSKFSRGGLGTNNTNSMAPHVSILDPVLAEICCKWFAFPECSMLDCFAGDSVFGYVASALGNKFTGIELRQEQADINSERIKDFAQSKYICDDGQNVLDHISQGSQDFLFSCPPYFDLEVYSDLKNDASNQGTYKEFLQIIESAFSNAIKCLKDDRFAVITVGDVRNKKTGGYYSFPDDIKTIFKSNGMLVYNEIILIEQSGTAALRASKIMEHRKVVKTHQNVLVFYKGNQKNIKSIFPKIDVREVPDESADV